MSDLKKSKTTLPRPAECRWTHSNIINRACCFALSIVSQTISRTLLRHWNWTWVGTLFHFIIGHSLFDIGYSIPFMRRPGRQESSVDWIFLLTCHNENCCFTPKRNFQKNAWHSRFHWYISALLWRPYRLAVRTLPFHGGSRGSSPLRVANLIYTT